MPSESPSAKSEIFPRSQGRESFNYMPFALGWAISIFYVDTLRPHCTAIRFHLVEGIFCKNRLLIRPTEGLVQRTGAVTSGIQHVHRNSDKTLQCEGLVFKMLPSNWPN